MFISYQSDHANRSTASSPSFNLTRDPPQEPTTSNDIVQAQTDQSTLLTVVHTSGLGQNSFANHSTLGSFDVDVVIVPSDIWSKAYHEAVDSFGKDIDVAILKGENVTQLFRQLEEIDGEATEESAFLRGVRHLHSLQVPLERFKLALDLATPLTKIEPTTSTVFGMVRSVTAVSSFHRNLTPRIFCESEYIGSLTRTYTDCYQLCIC